MIQKGFEAPQMSKPKENYIPMEENKIYKLNMAPIYIISIDIITSLQEKKMELQKYELSPQED